MTIWQYWEGPQPPYISLCLRTVVAHNDDVVVLDRAGFERLFTEDRDLNIDSLAINHRSDFIRTYLLYHHGGMYLDADCIVMRSARPVLAMAEQTGFAGFRETMGYMNSAFMAAKPGGDVIGAHYREICQRVRSGRPLEWLDLSSWPLNAAVSRYPNRCTLVPTRMVMPLSWTDTTRLSIRGGDDDHARAFEPDVFCYMLANHTIKNRAETVQFMTMPEAEVLAGDYFLSYLLRRALSGEGVAPPELPRPALPLALPIQRRMKGVEGWLEEDEADALIGLCAHAVRCAGGPPTVVEVGSFCGKATAVLGSAVQALCPEGRVYAIDPQDGKVGALDQQVFDCQPTLYRFWRAIMGARVDGVVSLAQARSHEVIWERPVHLLVIDHFHDYGSVLRDFRTFEPWLVSGAYAAFHDYADYYPGVKIFVGELLASGQYRAVQQVGTLMVVQKAPVKG